MTFGKKIERSVRYRLVRAVSFRTEKALRPLSSGMCRERGLPASALSPGNEEGLHAVIVCTDEDVDLVAWQLLSWSQQACRPSRLTLVGDGPEAVARMQRYFGPGGESWEIRSTAELLGMVDGEAGNFIRTWERSRPFGGYARKFAATWVLQEEGDILLLDADVLVFAEFFGRLAELIRASPYRPILAGVDFAPAYDRELVEKLGDVRLRQDAPLNCGVVWYRRQALHRVLADPLFEEIAGFADPADNHLEQTLVAYAFWQCGGAFLQEEDLVTTTRDQWLVRSDVCSRARHYAGAKPLFWRDLRGMVGSRSAWSKGGRR